jgi:hypothetical protein
MDVIGYEIIGFLFFIRMGWQGEMWGRVMIPFGMPGPTLQVIGAFETYVLTTSVISKPHDHRYGVFANGTTLSVDVSQARVFEPNRFAARLVSIPNLIHMFHVNSLSDQAQCM